MLIKQKLLMAALLGAAAVVAAPARADGFDYGMKKSPNPGDVGFIGVGASVGAGLGMRSANFAIAPSQRAMTLTEFSTRLGFDFASLPYGVELGGGLDLAYESMNGALGDGLSAFSGVNYGPDVTVERRFGRVSSLLALGYRIGDYTGKGTVNWNGDERVAAFFLNPGEDVNDERTKKFSSSGAHVTLGAGYDVVSHVTATLAVDLGFEKMSSDTRVVDGRTDLPGRNQGDYGSQALSIGAKVAL